MYSSLTGILPRKSTRMLEKQESIMQQQQKEKEVKDEVFSDLSSELLEDLEEFANTTTPKKETKVQLVTGKKTARRSNKASDQLESKMRGENSSIKRPKIQVKVPSLRKKEEQVSKRSEKGRK